MVKGAVRRRWAWLSSIMEFAAVTVVNHQQHLILASSDIGPGEFEVAGCRACYTHEKRRANVYGFRGGQA
jgi:hypothetical protein